MARALGINHVAIEVGEIDQALDWYGRIAQVRAALQREGVAVAASGSVDFTDPWGNRVQVVDYREIQFSKTPAVPSAMPGKAHSPRGVVCLAASRPLYITPASPPKSLGRGF